MALFQHWFNWFQLARVSALPTAISNVMLGYLLAVQLHAAPFSIGELLFLVLSSACLYSAGMILNDVFDVAVDRIERPERPLPSGRVDIATARRIGFGLLAMGVIIAGIGGWWTGANRLSDLMRPIGVAGLLAITILAYDRWLKQTKVAPFIMGACRLLNVLLGASTIVRSGDSLNDYFYFAPAVIGLSVSLGVYVTGLTLLARKEAVANSDRIRLWTGVGFIATGIVGLTFVNSFLPFSPLYDRRLADVFPWMMLLLAFPVLRKAITAARVGTPKAIQATIVSGLQSIIMFDAALCFLAAPDRPGYALSVISLLIPAIILSRWLKPT